MKAKWATGTVAVIVSLWIVVAVSASEIEESDSCKQLLNFRDPENRLRELGSLDDERVCDDCALCGMPIEFRKAVVTYTESVVASINAQQLKRRRSFAINDDRVAFTGRVGFPYDSSPNFDKTVGIPIAVLPRPESVRRRAESFDGMRFGWAPVDQPVPSVGSMYGKTLFFKAGKGSKQPRHIVPAGPFEAVLNPGFFIYFDWMLESGKWVREPWYDPYNADTFFDDSAALRFGNAEGAQQIAEFTTFRACKGNPRLRWVVRSADGRERRFLAYALIDGNGGARPRSSKGGWLDDKRVSIFVRPLTCQQHEPKIHSHSELLLPTPIWWPKNSRDAREVVMQSGPHEEWCLDDWFPAQKDACWVIREAQDSKPLLESILLMPASEPSDRPVFFIALFAETEPKQLVKELAALYKVSSDTALNSPETMQRLNSLYEKIRDFPLDK